MCKKCTWLGAQILLTHVWELFSLFGSELPDCPARGKRDRNKFLVFSRSKLFKNSWQGNQTFPIEY